MREKDSSEVDPCPSPLEHEQFLDDKLSSERQERLIKHLERCCRCQKVCDSLIKQLECNQSTTIVDISQSSNQVNRIVDLVKLRMQVADSLPGNRGNSLPIESTDLEELEREFQLIEELGRGGQGLVYLARDISLQRDVVIKLLSVHMQYSTESVERFKREARSLASVQSKYIVPIHRVGKLPSGRLYMIMEYVKGKTLRRLLGTSEIRSFQLISMIIQQVAQGLSAAHEQRLVHRDIKPENILIQSKDLLARIVDFGLAFDVADDARITVDGQIAGTPAYMSPEQITDPASVDFSTDLYSLGIVLYELLTGDVPFRGTTRMTLIRLIHEDAISPRVYNDQIPRDLETICLRAISKDRTKRFRSATQFAEELERFLNGKPIQSRPVGWIEHAWLRVKRSPGISALIGSIVLLVSLLALVSTIYAVQLSLLNKRMALQASISNQQRDAALSTLGDLTYQLQRKFDDPESYIEDIQQSTLEIALRGLDKLEGIAGQSAEGGLARAIAQRRLGQTLSRLDDEEASIQCLDKSETLLRNLLETDPQNKELAIAFADTTIARDECEGSPDPEIQLVRIAQAISFFQSDAMPDKEPATKVGLLLAYRAKYQLRQGLHAAAGESLTQGRQLLSNHWDSNQLPIDTALRDALLKIELSSIDLLRMEQKDHQDLAGRLLEQVMAVPDSGQQDAAVLRAQLLLFESLGLFAQASSRPTVGRFRQWIDNFNAQLFSQTKADAQEYSFFTEQIAIAAIDRSDLGLDSAARDLLILRAALAETRLGQQANDPTAVLELFDSHAALASIEFDSGTDDSQRSTIEYCVLALQGFETLATLSSVTSEEWYSLVDILEMFVESCQENGGKSGPSCRELIPWEGKLVRWLNDAELVAEADEEDLATCRELAQEIGELVKQ